MNGYHATPGDTINRLDRHLRIGEMLGPQSGSQDGGDPYGQGVDAPRYFFVDGDNGSDTNDGRDPRHPLLTVQAGVDKCVSGRHDVVHVRTASGAYVENVTVTSKDYVAIVGWGNGDWGRPDIHPASGVGLAVSLSQGFHGENLFIFSDDGDACTVDSNGWKFVNCRFMADGGSDGLLLKGHATNDSYTASQGEAIGCMFWLCGAAGVRMEHAEDTSGVGTTDNKFKDCVFKENVGADFLSAVGASGGTAGIFINLIIENCKFLDVGAAHVYMDMDQGVAGDLAANTALIIGNYFADEAIVAAQIAVGGQPNIMVVGNYDCAGLINGATFND